MNDDKSPLLDLMSCVVCSQTMKLEKIDPDSALTYLVTLSAREASTATGLRGVTGSHARFLLILNLGFI
jgi:hypothetical protein